MHNSGDPEGSTRQMTNPFLKDNGGIQTRIVRLDFPKVHQFFNYRQINPHQKILLASFHMEGKALVWFQDIETTRGISSWEGFYVHFRQGLVHHLIKISWNLLSC